MNVATTSIILVACVATAGFSLRGHMKSQRDAKAKADAMIKFAQQVVDDGFPNSMSRHEHELLGRALNMPLPGVISPTMTIAYETHTEFMPWATPYRYRINDTLHPVDPDLIDEYIANPPAAASVPKRPTLFSDGSWIP